MGPGLEVAWGTDAGTDPVIESVKNWFEDIDWKCLIRGIGGVLCLFMLSGAIIADDHDDDDDDDESDDEDFGDRFF